MFDIGMYILRAEAQHQKQIMAQLSVLLGKIEETWRRVRLISQGWKACSSF